MIRAHTLSGCRGEGGAWKKRLAESLQKKLLEPQTLPIAIEGWRYELLKKQNREFMWAGTPRPHLFVVNYLSTTEPGPPAEPLWRVTALMGGGGATGTRGQVSVSFPPIISWGSPLTPGPWKAPWILSCLRVSWARKSSCFNSAHPHCVSRSLPWVPTSCWSLLCSWLCPWPASGWPSGATNHTPTLFIVTQMWVSLGRPQEGL